MADISISLSLSLPTPQNLLENLSLAIYRFIHLKTLGMGPAIWALGSLEDSEAPSKVKTVELDNIALYKEEKLA